MWILILSRRDDPSGAVIARRHFDGGRMTIGRSHDCDWTIEDPDTGLSREHAMLSQQGLDLVIQDCNSSNGIYLNGQESRIAPMQPVVVRIGDRVTMGDFVVDVASAIGGIAVTRATVPTSPGRQPLPGMIDDGGIFSPTPTPSTTPPNPAGGPRAGGDIGPMPGSHDPIGGGRPRHPLLDDIAAPIGTGIRGSDGAGGMPVDPSPGAPNPFPGIFIPVEVTDQIPIDWIPDAPAPEVVPRIFPPIAPDIVPPPPEPMPVPGPMPPSQPETDRDVRVAWEAFCKGAGLDAADMPTADETSWLMLGNFYRQVLLGLSELIRERATFKQEFRIEATQFAMGRNNPIKWLPPRDAAKLLLRPPLPGYIEGDEAARDAFQDVKRHQLALLAGVQQVLASVLEELAPAAIEAQIRRLDQGKRKGWFGARPTDPWTIYRTIFESMQRESRSTDRGKISDAFRAGYERFLRNF